MKMSNRIKRALLECVILLCAIVTVTIVCDRKVYYNAKSKLYDSVPYRNVGLILGTSPISIWTNQRNYYFDHRIKAWTELYKEGEVDCS